MARGHFSGSGEMAALEMLVTSANLGKVAEQRSLALPWVFVFNQHQCLDDAGGVVFEDHGSDGRPSRRCLAIQAMPSNAAPLNMVAPALKKAVKQTTVPESLYIFVYSSRSRKV
jgi:hypothetical protein